MTDALILAAAWTPFMVFCALSIRWSRRTVAEWTDWAVAVELRQDALETRLDHVDVTLLDHQL